MTSKIYEIRSPAKAWYIAGTLAAIAIPFSIGLYYLWPIILYLEPACLTKTDEGCNAIRRYARIHPIRFPVCMTFIFGSVLAGILGALKVKRRIHTFKSAVSFGLIGLQSASLVQLICAIIYVFYFVFMGPTPQEFSADIAASAAVFTFMVGLVQLALWIFITMPLSVLCGMIFQWVACSPRPRMHIASGK